jgi:TATA-box binding protein (TBP) (component of TFIID and TFIIIB)
MDYKITNIKISVKCKNVSLDSVKKNLENSNIAYKTYNNYIVTKNLFTYIIFKKNINNIENINHVNITNIQSLELLDKAINNIQQFDCNIELLSYKIDNITVSKNFFRSFSIYCLISKIPSEIKITYNSETFPGVFLKFPNKEGTAIIFHTGKCVILGCKTVKNIEHILETLSSIVKHV